MNLVRTWVEAPPAIRWHLSRLRMPLLRRAFASIGANTVIVRPRTLRGVAQISLGADCSIFEGAWLQCESNPEATIHIGDRTYLGHDVHVHSIDPVHIGSDCVLADYVLVTSTDHDRVERKVTHGTGAVMIDGKVVTYWAVCWLDDIDADEAERWFEQFREGLDEIRVKATGADRLALERVDFYFSDPQYRSQVTRRCLPTSAIYAAIAARAFKEHDDAWH